MSSKRNFDGCFSGLPNLDENARRELQKAFDRLINKLLHPPMESIRHESQNPRRWTLREALARLFQIRDESPINPS